MNRIKTTEMRFTDEFGRERIFNGVNIVDKSDYKAGKQEFSVNVDDELCARFVANGINMLRLGFTWAKIEPVPGQYNDEYLDCIDEILERCAKHGIYTFLDMHQDLYSSTCNGDGAPKWATLTDKYKVKPIKGVWAAGYFIGKYCQRAFDNFWDNKKVNGKGLQDYYSDCWSHIADRFKNKEALFGFDVMNEPFPGMCAGKAFKAMVAKAARVVMFDREVNRAAMLKALFSKDRVPQILSNINFSVVRKATSVFDKCIREFDVNKYSPFVSKTASAIRTQNDNGIILLENSYWSNVGIPFSGLPIAVNGKREPNQAFAPHAYDFLVDTPLYKFASNDRAGGMFVSHRQSQNRLEVPVIVGEWGGCGGADNDAWLPHITFLLALFDSYKWSNTYWCYTNGWLDSVLMQVFVRPYPIAVTGLITRYFYDRENDIFTLAFSQDNEYTCGTEIFVHKRIHSVLLDGENTAFDCVGNVLTINTTPGNHSIDITFEKDGEV